MTRYGRQRITLQMPPNLDGSGLLVGWSHDLERARTPMGFSFGDPKLTPATGFIDPILMENEGHLITIAPTGAGKGTACLIPALLRFDGPVIVIDPKGENALVTARRRREMGHQVAIIDPLKITGLETAGLNPMDLLDPDSPTCVDDTLAMLQTLLNPHLQSSTSNGEYWSERGNTFVLGVMLHVLADLPEERRHLGTVRELVAKAIGEIGLYTEAVQSDSPLKRKGDLSGTVLGALERSRHPEAVRIGQMLRMGAASTLGGILSFSQSIVEIARGQAITDSLMKTDFSLDAVTRGDPLSIYLVLPPHMLDSHGQLLRLWVHTLTTLITRRNAKPPKATLFLLDEAAQLGTFSPLRRAITLMRGYGLQTWSFWQDPSQLRNLYPNDWQTMVNNCRAVQCFGANTMLAAESMASIVGYHPPDRLLDMGPDEMLLQLSGDAPQPARLPNYLVDPAFEGMFDPNPFHDPNRPIMRTVEVPVDKPRPKRKSTKPKSGNGKSSDVLSPDELSDLLDGPAEADTPKPPKKGKAADKDET